ncbi:MAG: hypothetical protein CME62_13775 [Halobacteriovoraceae bacterium]|nr:hypothetical protein [Halobacteriovoraceae bacterium]|tara:strand:+ start:151 stop:750 length:600 start_codon:yes stop_codon:yes gene_type:complete
MRILLSLGLICLFISVNANASALDLVRGKGLLKRDTNLDRMSLSNIGSRNYKIELTYRDFLGYPHLCEIFTMGFTAQEKSVLGIIGSKQVGSIKIGPHRDSIDTFHNIVLRDKKVHVANRSRSDFTAAYNTVRKIGQRYVRSQGLRSDDEFEIEFSLDHYRERDNELEAAQILKVLGYGNTTRGLNNLKLLIKNCKRFD